MKRLSVNQAQVNGQIELDETNYFVSAVLYRAVYRLVGSVALCGVIWSLRLRDLIFLHVNFLIYCRHDMFWLGVYVDE